VVDEVIITAPAMAFEILALALLSATAHGVVKHSVMWQTPPDPLTLEVEVGDSVEFTWSGDHNVWSLPNRAAYDACRFTDGFQMCTKSPCTLNINTSSEPLLLVCTMASGAHCTAGMKMILTLPLVSTTATIVHTACDTDFCPIGFVLKPNAAAIACVNQDCTFAECCDLLGTYPTTTNAWQGTYPTTTNAWQETYTTTPSAWQGPCPEQYPICLQIGLYYDCVIEACRDGEGQGDCGNWSRGSNVIWGYDDNADSACTSDYRPTEAVSSDTCHKIPANRVWDVQWSGDPSASTEYFSYFNTPYISSVGRLHVLYSEDYFTLRASNTSNKYLLRHHSMDGTIMSIFPEGEVKANSEVAFYVVDGFYGTLITKEAHQKGDSASVSNLREHAPKTLVQEALFPSCLDSEATDTTTTTNAGQATDTTTTTNAGQEKVTCGMVKASYRSNECCGNPSKEFVMDSNRRLHAESATAYLETRIANALKDAKATGGTHAAQGLARRLSAVIAKNGIGA